MVMKPAWLDGLMAETFFAGCGVHENRRKNEKNVFCLECCQSVCPHCLPSHRSHPLLQVLIRKFKIFFLSNSVWLMLSFLSFSRKIPPDGVCFS